MKNKIILGIFLVLIFQTGVFASTSFTIPVEFLNNIARQAEFKTGTTFIQRLLINQAIKNASINGVKLKNLTSQNLADYFNADNLFEKLNSNKLVEPNTGATLEFNSDGSCMADNCTVTVDLNGDKGPNEFWTDSSDPKDRVKFIIKRDNEGNITVVIPDNVN